MKITNTLKAFIALMAFCLLSAGCGRNGAAEKTGFNIPPSLVDRMRGGYNRHRNKWTGSADSLDGEEMMALMRLGYENAPKIAERLRGEMFFADDGRSEDERRQLWPFDVESFEATLEKSLGLDENGLLCLKDDDGELFPFNPSMRSINEQIEHWAIQQLDTCFKRVDSDTYAKMTGNPVKEDEEILVWVISQEDNEYFAIARYDGAWNIRSYQYLIWDGNANPSVYADFYSFPNRKEAVAMRTLRYDCRSLNNLAVLYWRHRIFPLQFNPREIKEMLEIAQRDGVPCAKANLKVLNAHIPEVDQQ